MKPWNELTEKQQNLMIAFFIYLASDQWWFDALEDAPEWCETGLRKHGYDPATMTTEEKVRALESIDDDEDW